MGKLKSRKLIMAILAGFVGVAKVYYPDFPEESFWAIVGAIVTYILAQGAVDTAQAMKKPSEGEKVKVGGTE